MNSPLVTLQNSAPFLFLYQFKKIFFVIFCDNFFFFFISYQNCFAISVREKKILRGKTIFIV